MVGWVELSLQAAAHPAYEEGGLQEYGMFRCSMRVVWEGRSQ